MRYSLYPTAPLNVTFLLLPSHEVILNVLRTTCCIIFSISRYLLYSQYVVIFRQRESASILITFQTRWATFFNFKINYYVYIIKYWCTYTYVCIYITHVCYILLFPWKTRFFKNNFISTCNYLESAMLTGICMFFECFNMKINYALYEEFYITKNRWELIISQIKK